MKQELIILPEHMRLLLVLVNSRYSVFIFLCSVFSIICLGSFCLFFIQFIRIIRIMASDYPFAIFKPLFVHLSTRKQMCSIQQHVLWLLITPSKLPNCWPFFICRWHKDRSKPYKGYCCNLYSSNQIAKILGYYWNLI